MNTTHSSTLFLVVEALSLSTEQSSNGKVSLSRGCSGLLLFYEATVIKENQLVQGQVVVRLDVFLPRRGRRRVTDQNSAIEQQASPSVSSATALRRQTQCRQSRCTQPPKRGPSNCGEHSILREPRRPEPVRRRTVRQKNCPWTPATAAAEITAPSVQRYSPSPR